jgi:hypothetical protein
MKDAEQVALFEKFMEQTARFADICSQLALSEQQRVMVDRQILSRLDELTHQNKEMMDRIQKTEARLYGSADRDLGLVGQINNVQQNLDGNNLKSLKTKVEGLTFQMKILWGSLGFVALTLGAKIIDSLSSSIHWFN